MVKKNLWSRDGAPTMPLNNLISTTFTQTWEASTDNLYVTGYKLYLDGYFLTTVNGLSYTHTGLNGFQSYYFGVSAIDSDGNESEINWTNELIAVPDADVTPDAPVISYNSINCDGVTMKWVEPYDNVGVVSYNVYEGNTVLANVPLFINSYEYRGYAGTSVLDISVSALDATGNESSRLGSSIIIPACGITPPAVNVTYISSTVVSILWTSSLDPGIDWNRLTINGVFYQDRSASLGNFFVFTGLTPSSSYTFGVSYVDTGVGTSAESLVSVNTLSLENTSFSVSTRYTNETDACNSTDNSDTYYHNGSGAFPFEADRVKTNLPFTSNPVNGWYKVIGQNYAIEVINGFVEIVSLCS